jgi:hypothetical protein
VVFARPAPRPAATTLFRASNHLGRFGIAWTSCREFAEFWRSFERCAQVDGGKHQRSIYRFGAGPGDVLARAFYPDSDHRGCDEWILGPSRLNDETVVKLPLRIVSPSRQASH